MESLAKRIKRYESVSNPYLTPNVPVMIRVDGRAFHTFTRGARKPFDQRLISAMEDAAFYVAEKMQGFKVAYVQSDEATFLLTDYDNIETQGWFGYKVNKIVSISAALMSVYFNDCLKDSSFPETNAVFDSRAFNVPKSEVVNTFLWRAKDWERNSLQMYARSIFSHKELHEKKRGDIHEMLHREGKNWTTDLTNQEKNGTFIIKTPERFEVRHDIPPSYYNINHEIRGLF